MQQSLSTCLNSVILALLTGAQQKNKQANRAWAWARTLVDPQEKAHALLGIAKGLTARLATSNVRSMCDGTNW